MMATMVRGEGKQVSSRADNSWAGSLSPSTPCHSTRSIRPPALWIRRLLTRYDGCLPDPATRSLDPVACSVDLAACSLLLEREGERRGGIGAYRLDPRTTRGIQEREREASLLRSAEGERKWCRWREGGREERGRGAPSLDQRAARERQERGMAGPGQAPGAAGGREVMVRVVERLWERGGRGGAM